MTEPRTYFYPPIDYRAHPAFSGLAVPQRQDDAVVEDMIDRIDDSLARLHAGVHPDAQAVEQAFSVGVGAEIRALASYLAARPGPDRMRSWLARSFEDVASELHTEAQLHNRRHDYAGDTGRKLEARAVRDALSSSGAYVCHTDDETMGRLRQLTAAHRCRLRDKARANPSGRVVENFDRYSDVGLCLERFFDETGIIGGLSAFRRAHVNFTGCALEYSHDRQTWWRGCYEDLGVPDSRTAYMHYDHGCKNPKAIIAISDVSPENGPTCYVKGSHLAGRSNFVHFMVKSLDLRFYDDYTNRTGDAYYRRRFRELEHRREFLTLPRALQACSHFGEDVADDSAVSHELLSREMRVTKDVGDCVVFDGDYGIHRGAMVTKGERFAFQIIFAVEPPVAMSTVVARRARYFLYKTLRGSSG